MGGEIDDCMSLRDKSISLNRETFVEPWMRMMMKPPRSMKKARAVRQEEPTTREAIQRKLLGKNRYRSTSASSGPRAAGGPLDSGAAMEHRCHGVDSPMRHPARQLWDSVRSL